MRSILLLLFLASIRASGQDSTEARNIDSLVYGIDKQQLSTKSLLLDSNKLSSHTVQYFFYPENNEVAKIMETYSFHWGEARYLFYYHKSALVKLYSTWSSKEEPKEVQAITYFSKDRIIKSNDEDHPGIALETMRRGYTYLNNFSGK